MKYLNSPMLNATLPSTAVSVLLMGVAANHTSAGPVTFALFAAVVAAFLVQLAATLRRH